MDIFRKFSQTNFIFFQQQRQQKTLCFLLTKSNVFCQQFEYTKYIRRPSKFNGYGLISNTATRKVFKRKMERILTRDYMKTFGINDIESIMLILSSSKQQPRRLDEHKRKQLEIIYTKVLSELIANDENLKGILITKIDLPEFMHEIRVSWRCTCDVEKDRIIEERLNEQEGLLRTKMQETLYNTSLPQLKFFPDRHHIKEEEMSKLFEMADYGEEYRAFSKVGFLAFPPLKSKQNNVETEKRKTPPRWLDSWRRRIKEDGHN